MNENSNLTDFVITCDIGLLQVSSVGMRLPPKRSRLEFNASEKLFSLYYLEKPKPQIELRAENLHPLRVERCPNGRCYNIGFKKDGVKFEELNLKGLSEMDKQMLHATLLQLVGVKRGSVSRKTAIGNQNPMPTNRHQMSAPYTVPATAKTPSRVAAPAKMPSMIPATAKTPSLIPATSKTPSRISATARTPSRVPATSKNPSSASFTPVAVTKTPSSASFSPMAATKTPSNTNVSPMDRFSTTLLQPQTESNTSNKENEATTFNLPPDEMELPKEYLRRDFWKTIEQDEKLRTGVCGEWVKGQAEHLTIEGLLCLKDGEWLNADMIDAYLSFICREFTGVQYIPTYGILSYERKKKIPSEWYWQLEGTDTVLAPAHLNNNHWAMAVLDMHAKSMQLMDSMNNGFTGETKREFMRTILNILMDVAEQQEYTEIGEREEWTCEEVIQVPQQMNGTDCGIFALIFARLKAEKKPLQFDQTHIAYYRRKICHDIISAANTPKANNHR